MFIPPGPSLESKTSHQLYVYTHSTAFILPTPPVHADLDTLLSSRLDNGHEHFSI